MAVKRKQLERLKADLPMKVLSMQIEKEGVSADRDFKKALCGKNKKPICFAEKFLYLGSDGCGWQTTGF